MRKHIKKVKGEELIGCHCEAPKVPKQSLGLDLSLRKRGLLRSSLRDSLAMTRTRKPVNRLTNTGGYDAKDY